MLLHSVFLQKNDSAHEYEKNSGLYDEEFGLDGEKFVITGEVEINDKTYLYIYDNEYEYSFGVEILDVMPLKLSSETVRYNNNSICYVLQIHLFRMIFKKVYVILSKFIKKG